MPADVAGFHITSVCDVSINRLANIIFQYVVLSIKEYLRAYNPYNVLACLLPFAITTITTMVDRRMPTHWNWWKERIKPLQSPQIFLTDLPKGRTIRHIHPKLLHLTLLSCLELKFSLPKFRMNIQLKQIKERKMKGVRRVSPSGCRGWWKLAHLYVHHLPPNLATASPGEREGSRSSISLAISHLKLIFWSDGVNPCYCFS